MTKYNIKTKYVLNDVGVRFFEDLSLKKSFQQMALDCGISLTLMYQISKKHFITTKTLRRIKLQFPNLEEGVHYNEIK